MRDLSWEIECATNELSRVLDTDGSESIHELAIAAREEIERLRNTESDQ